jgi:hypothetical protein
LIREVTITLWRTTAAGGLVICRRPSLWASCLVAGLLRTPRAALRAFARGRATQHGLYHVMAKGFDDHTLDDTMAALRSKVGVPDEASVGITDVVMAIGWGMVGIAVNAGPVAVAIGLLVWASRLLR